MENPTHLLDGTHSLFGVPLSQTILFLAQFVHKILKMTKHILGLRGNWDP